MAFEDAWDEEKARERRIAARRERVQERLRQARQDGTPQPEKEATDPANAATRGQRRAAASAEAVRAAHAAAWAEAEAARGGAEARTDAHRDQCDAEEAALRERVAAEAEASRQENRAIDLEWERLQAIRAPQELHAGMQGAAARCAAVLASKDGVLGAAAALLGRRDEQYSRLLRVQADETDRLIASIHAAAARCKGVAEAELEAAEAAFLQERAELAAAHKAELGALLEARAELEAAFMGQYLGACEAAEEELEALRAAGAGEHFSLRRRLEGEVAALEGHLEGARRVHALNADRLDYNHRVLVERERECKEALAQQKRRITRQWEALNRLKKRHAASDGRAAADNARLGDEYRAVTRAFTHLQSKYAHFKAADLGRFSRVQAMKEGELDGLLAELAEAGRLIAAHVAALPPDEAVGGAADGSSSGAGEGAAGGDGSASDGGASAALEGLVIVGQAVAVDPLARAAAAAALGPGEAPTEVVACEAVGQAGGLIQAYRPGRDEPVSTGAAAADSPDRPGSAAGMDALAWEELAASADTGALSLLLLGEGGGSSGAWQVQASKLRELLAGVPQAADGRLSADDVARCLGLHRSTTAPTLSLLFAGRDSLDLRQLGAAGSSSSPSAGLAETIQPLLEAAQPGAPNASGNSSPAAAEPTFRAEQVEQGLRRLLQLLAAGGSRQESRAQPAAGAGAVPTSGGAAAVAARPSSKAYWQARADAVLPPAVACSWQLLERQAGQHFAMLQGRAAAAKEVLELSAENERLKAQLAGLVGSPLNRELQLPPTLLLGLRARAAATGEAAGAAKRLL